MEPSATPFGGIDKIIGVVNSPLALAALAILVVGIVLYATKGGRANAPLIYCGFGLAALFGVLAILGFIYENQQIALVRGTVVDARGTGVEGVLVDLLGVGASETLIGRGATTRDGGFVIPLETAARRDSYRIEARKPGFEDAAVERPGPRPEPGRIVVKERAFTAADLAVDGAMWLAIYVGTPEVRLDFSADNETDRDETATMSLNLVGPSGQRLSLYPATYFDDRGGSRPFMPPATFSRLQKNRLRLLWNNGAQMNNAVQQVLQLTGGPGMAGCGQPDPSPLSEGIARLFDENFAWEPGTWQARLSIGTADTTLAKTFAFTLGESDSRAMRAMRAVNTRCDALIYGAHLQNVGAARGFVQVEMQQAPP